MSQTRKFKLLCLASLLSYAQGESHNGVSRAGNCEKLCSVLNDRYPDLLDYQGELGYAGNYWSNQQQEEKPACRFSPTCAEEVSTAIKFVSRFECPFAVKGGGHASFAGASNIQNGLAIDLRNLNTIAVFDDRKIASLGTGLHWDSVYDYLDERNLSVIGGRSGDVGVSGLTLGGGISFFSGVYGWACDNVENYQVVLGDGRIVDANPNNYADLYHALRGGGNNFGVVTRMDASTMEQGLMLGGASVYSTAQNGSIYDAYYQFNENADDDPKAALIVSAACIKNSGCIFSNNYNYMDPAPIDKVPIYRNFTAIPSLSSTVRIAHLSNFTTELQDTQPPGYRQSFITWTVKNDAQLLKDMFEIFYHELQPLMKDTTLSLASFVSQPISKPMIRNFAKNGGNALGLSEQDGPLTLMDMDFQWNSTAEDTRITGVQQSIMKKCVDAAKSRGLSHRYLYQNYASITQDVFSGYGPESKQRLLNIQRKYDPLGFFTKLQPGYFKL